MKKMNFGRLHDAIVGAQVFDRPLRVARALS
jgi:hypothetical protein